MLDKLIQPGVAMSTTRSDIVRRIQSARPPGAVSYVLSRDGSVVSRLRLKPFEPPPIDLASGTYNLMFINETGGEVSRFELEYDGSGSFTSTVEEAIAAVDYDHEARLELDRQKTSTYYRATIDHYLDHLAVLGSRGKAEVRVKELQQEVYEKLIENNLRMLEAINARIAKIQTPPEPPQWDKMIGAAAPAFAAMYIETVRAIKGNTSPGPSPELLLPSGEKTSRLYELLGNVASSERLNAMLQDKEKLSAWVDAVRNFMKDNPNAKPDKSTAQPETVNPKSE